MNEAVALVALAATLAAAVARPRWAPDWAVAVGAAALLVAVGVVSVHRARVALGGLGPTVGFLAALLVLADGCRRVGLFKWVGGRMASGARGHPDRLLAMVFLTASATTAVLSLDATIVLLTPVVFATAARLLADSRPHVYACSHLANNASLLLPVSNLTNLLAFHASGLAFARFAELMALPWLAALAIEWLVLKRSFAAELGTSGPAECGTSQAAERGTSRAEARVAPPGASARAGEHAAPPVFALWVLAATLAGFLLSSLLGIAPVWIAAAGAVAIALRERPTPAELLRAADPLFLVFVLGLGVVVAGASEHGLASAVDAMLPPGTGLPALLGVAAIAAVVANLVNNLPATLIILPVAARGSPGAVLAMLVGVNVGPNLTYVGSLATLLWRRVVHAHDQPTSIGEFTRLGVRTVPAVLAASTLALWFALRVL